MGLSDVFISGNSICSVRMSILVSLLPVVIIGLGAKHLFDCPKQPMVPIYMLVGGIACLSLQIFPVFYCGNLNGKVILPCRIFNFLLLVFCPIWFITGSIFVYTAYKPNFEFRSSAEYCERIVYQFAFWITNAIYISIPVLLLAHGCKICWERRTLKKPYISTIS